MDELDIYLKNRFPYVYDEIEQILNKKIIINKDHIRNIKQGRGSLIYLFETYGYCFTNDDYIMLISDDESILNYIPKDKRTVEIYEAAVRKNGNMIIYVPTDKITNNICKLAIQQNCNLLEYIPEDMKTEEILKLVNIYP